MYNYQFINGISDTLNGMNRRTKGKSGMQQAMCELMVHYDAFESDFKLVFKDLMLVSKDFILEF
ncbi:MAG: ACP phosphodiesterase [Bacteroidota bacterium]|nr:ACP phosphodiesterase [Bacteroidota bacterium]